MQLADSNGHSSNGQLHPTRACAVVLQLSEMLSEVAAARSHVKQAVVQAAVGALKAALASLPRTQTSAAAAASGSTGSAAAAAALGAAISSLGPDAQVGFDGARLCVSCAAPAGPATPSGTSLSGSHQRLLGNFLVLHVDFSLRAVSLSHSTRMSLTVQLPRQLTPAAAAHSPVLRPAQHLLQLVG